MDESEAKRRLHQCFAKETTGLQESFAMHRTAVESYRAFIESANYLSPANRDMRTMSHSSIPAYLKRNQHSLARFKVT
jgi:hypothetical protein